jgi:LPS export ABC transporter protein LptC
VKFAFAAVFVSALLMASCENDIQKVHMLTSRNHDPISKVKDIEILYSDSARVQVKVTAPALDQYESENPYIEFSKGLKADFYDDHMVAKSHLSADYGIRYEKQERMEARKNVVVVNEKGEQLNTEHLIWDEKTGKLYSDDFVKITTPDEVLTGNGFISNQDFTKWKIYKLKGDFPVKKNKSI